MAGIRPRFPIGISDFRRVREEGYVYVDKTGLIQDILEAGAAVMLVPRPRRFGKTINLSMLRCFFEKSPEDLGRLFAGLGVAGSEVARPHFQRYPVVFLTLKDVKETSWERCLAEIARQMAKLFGEHREVLESGGLLPEEVQSFSAVLDGTATSTQLRSALADLSGYLAKHRGEQVVVLLDEYDTPIHAAFNHGYDDEAVAFFRGLLSGAFKDNRHLFKGVITGILRVAKESIFSGLNNLAVYSFLRPELSRCFGFTEHEVAKLCVDVGQPELLEGLRGWYNGYLFAGQVIYNPWSVLNVLDSEDKALRPYWVATSSDDLIRDLLLARGADVHDGMEALLRGEEVEQPIEETLVLRDLDRSPEAVWSLLLFSGYLKVTAQRWTDRRLWCRLAIPNEEVLSLYETVFRRWLEHGLGSAGKAQALARALLAGDGETFEELLEELMLRALSFHDTAGGTAGQATERVYQAFILGLLVHLEGEYLVRSNRESGLGRYDVLIAPRAPGRPGAVLELKVPRARRGETAEQALEAALRQIRKQRYSEELRALGARPIREVGVVFDGKRVWTRFQEGEESGS